MVADDAVRKMIEEPVAGVEAAAWSRPACQSGRFDVATDPGAVAAATAGPTRATLQPGFAPAVNLRVPQAWVPTRRSATGTLDVMV